MVRKICQELGVECPHIRLELNEDDAFALGVTLNLMRRQLSLEQIKEIREKQRKIALQLRKQGKSQPEVAKIVGVNQSTISDWEKEKGNNTSACNASAVPDLRVSIPKSERKTIYVIY